MSNPRPISEPEKAHLNNLLEEIISATNPGYRYLGENVDAESIRSNSPQPKRLPTPLADQRHPGKPAARLSRTTVALDNIRDWEEDLSTTAPSIAITKEALPMKLTEDNHTPQYPGPLALTFLIIGICLSVFLISLDRTIITTAIPFITSEFHSYDDIGWYGSAYLLTACAFQPLYGRIFTSFNIKWAYLCALMIFELGSLICGIAPKSVTLIVGRAIAGIGSAGILTGSFVVVAHAVPLQKRPVYTAAVGLMFGVGAVVGPLLGGVFTDLVTWRWCFYFNLPVGGATLGSMVLFFHPHDNATRKRPILDRILDLDLIGNAILLGASIMFFLALQRAAQTSSWGTSYVIGLLVGCGLTTMIFIAWDWWRGDRALIPFRVASQRSVAASCISAFFIYSALLIHSYYLPIWFQAIKNNSAVHSGVNMIPYMLANALLSLLAGIAVSKTGYFTPPAIVGCAIGVVGCGLLSTLMVTTPSSNWIGYEILVSAGLGMAVQQGFTAVQTVLPFDDVPIGTAAVVASQSLGGAVFVSVGNNILQDMLLKAAKDNMLPGVNIHAVIDAGASDFRHLVPRDVLPALLHIYNNALRKVFLVAVPCTGLAFLASLFLEWKSIKAKKPKESASTRDTEAIAAEPQSLAINAEKDLFSSCPPSHDGTNGSGVEPSHAYRRSKNIDAGFQDTPSLSSQSRISGESKSTAAFSHFSSRVSHDCRRFKDIESGSFGEVSVSTPSHSRAPSKDRISLASDIEALGPHILAQSRSQSQSRPISRERELPRSSVPFSSLSVERAVSPPRPYVHLDTSQISL